MPLRRLESEPGQDRKVAALSLALDVGKAFLIIAPIVHR